MKSIDDSIDEFFTDPAFPTRGGAPGMSKGELYTLVAFHALLQRPSVNTDYMLVAEKAIQASCTLVAFELRERADSENDGEAGQ